MVWIGEQGAHGRRVFLEDGIAPDLFKVVDLVAALVLLRPLQSGEKGNRAHCQQQRRPQHPGCRQPANQIRGLVC
jgi:hypothetical protein